MLRRALTLPLLLTLSIAAQAVPPPAEPVFEAAVLDPKIEIGYGLAIADVDGDSLPDVLLADKKQFVWYRNPGKAKARDIAAWQKFVLAENLTGHDNVCIAAQDVDGDGKCEIAVGAEWNPSDTVGSGAVFYLLPGADRTQPWDWIKFPDVEPTTHRMKWVKLKNGTWSLAVLPLHGKGNKNGEGAGVKVTLYHPPKPINDPNGEWKTEVINEAMHMTHNLHLVGGATPSILIGGKEGVQELRQTGEASEWPGTWWVKNSGKEGECPGAGEVRLGKLNQIRYLTTVEPMHGNQLVVYVQSPGRLAVRKVLTDKLTDGHALACADFIGAGSDQVVIGWRGKPGAAGSTTGLSIWTPLDAAGAAWRETAVDKDGMACEDVQTADLDGDGKADIIAAGRATKNIKIYFNSTASKQ